MYSFGVVLVVGLLGGGSAVATAALAPTSEAPVAAPLVSCAHACTWRGTSFTGEEHDASCAEGSYEVGIRRSAVDGCSGETMRLNNGRELVACMNPTGERPNPGEFKTVTVTRVAC
jgi:hypothetical protein